MLAHAGQLFELGLRLIPVIVKAGLAICGIGGQGGSGAPVALSVWPSLMAICPATHAANGALVIMCSALQTAAHCACNSSWIGWLVRAVVFVVSALADCSVSQVCGCALACLASCVNSLVLQQALGFFLNM
jgi:hypothetical protein